MVVPKKPEAGFPPKARSVHPVVAASVALALNAVAFTPTLALAEENAGSGGIESTQTEQGSGDDQSYGGYGSAGDGVSNSDYSSSDDTYNSGYSNGSDTSNDAGGSYGDSLGSTSYDKTLTSHEGGSYGDSESQGSDEKPDTSSDITNTAETEQNYIDTTDGNSNSEREGLTADGDTIDETQPEEGDDVDETKPSGEDLAQDDTTQGDTGNSDNESITDDRQDDDTSRTAEEIEQEISDLERQKSYRETMIGEYEGLRDEVKTAYDAYEDAKTERDTAQEDVSGKISTLRENVGTDNAEANDAIDDLEEAYKHLVTSKAEEDDFTHRKEEGTRAKDEAEGHRQSLQATYDEYKDDAQFIEELDLENSIAGSTAISNAASDYLDVVEERLASIKSSTNDYQSAYNEAQKKLEGIASDKTELGKLVSDLVDAMSNALKAVATYDEKYIKLYDLLNPLKLASKEVLTLSDVATDKSLVATYYKDSDIDSFHVLYYNDSYDEETYTYSCHLISADNEYTYRIYNYDNYYYDADGNYRYPESNDRAINKWEETGIESIGHGDEYFYGQQWGLNMNHSVEFALTSLDSWIGKSKADIDVIQDKIDSLTKILPPEPEPEPDPDPTPEPEPDPDPTPEPEPEPDPDPTPEPEPIQVIDNSLTVFDYDRSSSTDSDTTASESATQTTATQTPAVTQTPADTSAATTEAAQTLSERIEDVEIGIEVDSVGTEDVKVTGAPVLTELMDGYYNVERMPELDRDLLAKNAQDEAIKSADDIGNYWWYVYINGEKVTIMDANGVLAKGIEQVVWMTKEDFEKLGLLGDNVVIAQTSGLVVVLTASSTLGVDVLRNDEVKIDTIVPTPDDPDNPANNISDVVDDFVPTADTGSVSSRIASYIPQATDVIEATDSVLAATGDPSGAAYVLSGLAGVASLLTGGLRRRRKH